MKINEKRLLANLHALKAFTDTPGNGVTRFSYGLQDAKARTYILKRAADAGCTIKIDPLQNIRIGLRTNIPGRKIVMAGSHIDTVRNGGWLDGIYGVCGALEALETLSENLQPSDAEVSAVSAGANYEMVIFAEEEGSGFGSTMAGSKFAAGLYDESALDTLKNDEGQPLRQVLETLPQPYIRQPLTGVELRWELSEIKTMLELHIEQGPVLDREGLSLGIVDAIYGMRVIEVTLTGVGNHAGATPMTERYDALCTASECILAAEETARADEDKRTVVTVGKMELMPNCSNVIPETVRFTLEVRDKEEAKINSCMDDIIHRIDDLAAARKVNCHIEELSRSSPLPLTRRLIRRMEERAAAQGLAYRIMDSGAVHDACMMANHVDTGMIFVPSTDGRSHVPQEDTREEYLITGAQFLLDTILDELDIPEQSSEPHNNNRRYEKNV